MLRTALVLAVASPLLWSTPAQANFSDARIEINFVTVIDDPQTGDTPSSEVMDDLGSSGSATASGGFVPASGLPPTHLLEASIDLTSKTGNSITARSFTSLSQQFDISDFDMMRFGSVDLRVTFSIDWSTEFGAGVAGDTFKRLDFAEFDSFGSFSQLLGFMAASSTDGGAPMLSGSDIDFSSINVFQAGSIWHIQGDAFLDFNGGSVNSTDNYFGPQFGSEITMFGGAPGDFLYSGNGNFVSWTMASTEPSVGVSPLPAPAAGVLLSLGLVALAARRSRRQREPSGR